MFPRFVAASAVACIAIALGALALTLIPGLGAQRFYPLPIIWCFVPAAWGIWAMLAPRSWLTTRLPIWGAILGGIASLLGVFVLNLPLRILGLTLPMAVRVLVVIGAAGAYYFLWMLVRVAYESVAPHREDVTSIGQSAAV